MTDYPDLCKSEYKGKTSVRLKRPTLLAFAFAAGKDPFALYGDPKAYSALMDNVGKTLAAWPGRNHIDPTRIGAFGFSAGGFTVLTAVGGHPDLRIIPSHCATRPEFVCNVLRAADSPLVKDNAKAIDGFAADKRIRAVVLAAPGLGFTFSKGGLAKVAVPVQLWTGENDRVTPHEG